MNNLPSFPLKLFMLKVLVESAVNAINHVDSSHASSMLLVGELVAVFNEVGCTIASSNCWIKIMN